MATGVLPILIGKATKCSKYLINHDKIYEVRLSLGKKTDTADKEGKIIEEQTVSENCLNEANVKQVFKSFIGKQTQIPPMYSAIKEEKFVVNLSEEILEVISMEENDNLLAETVKIRQDLAERLGYVIPHIHFHNSDELLQNEFNIKIHDIEVFRSVVFPECVAFYKDELKGYKSSEEDIVVTDDITGKKMVWLPKEKVKDFWVQGLTAVEYIGKAIEYIAVKEVSDIMDYNDVNKYVEKVIETNSFLVDNIIPDFITASDLKYLLTCLVREHVSVKNIVYIFEKINDYANEPTKEDLLDKVRLALSKHIIKDLAQDGELKVIEFSDEIVDKIYSFFKEDEDESIIRIDSTEIQDIVTKLMKFAKSKKIVSPIVAVPMDIRHMVFVIMSEFVQDLTVLAYEELVSNYNIKFVGKVG